MHFWNIVDQVSKDNALKNIPKIKEVIKKEAKLRTKRTRNLYKKMPVGYKVTSLKKNDFLKILDQRKSVVVELNKMQNFWEF